MERRFLNILGLVVAVYENHGREIPSLFFLHANSQDAAAFSHQIDGELGRRFRVVCIDLPGHGASSKADNPDRVCSLEGYISVVKEVVRQLDLRSTVFVGHSLGGHILIQAANELSGLLGLLVFGTPPLRLPPRFDVAFLPHATTSLIFREQLSAADGHQWAQAQMLRAIPRETQRIEEAMHHTDPRCRSSLGKAVAQGVLQDECAILQSLPVPIAILLGEQDPFVNRAYCNALPLPNLWRGGIQIVAGSGHSPQLEKPEVFNTLLTDFVLTCMVDRNTREEKCDG